MTQQDKSIEAPVDEFDTTETVEATEASDIEQASQKVSGVTLAIRIIWFITGFINTLLALRITLMLLGANDSAGFVTFIYDISDPFAAPFAGMFPEPVRGVSALDISSIFAIIMYTLIAWGITKLITISRPREES